MRRAADFRTAAWTLGMHARPSVAEGGAAVLLAALVAVAARYGSDRKRIENDYRHQRPTRSPHEHEVCATCPFNVKGATTPKCNSVHCGPNGCMHVVIKVKSKDKLSSTNQAVNWVSPIFIFLVRLFLSSPPACVSLWGSWFIFCPLCTCCVY